MVASEVAKVNAPLVVTVRRSPPLFARTTVPLSPETVPPTEYKGAGAGAGVATGSLFPSQRQALSVKAPAARTLKRIQVRAKCFETEMKRAPLLIAGGGVLQICSPFASKPLQFSVRAPLMGTTQPE